MSPSRFGSDPVGGPGRPAPASKPASSKAGLPLSRQAPFPPAPPARPPSNSKPAGSTPPAPAASPGRSAAVKNVRGPRPPARTPDPPRTPPILVRQMRGGVVEARHRGAIVEVGTDGAVRRALGDPETLVNLRSAVKPFGLVALIEAGGVDAFDLSDAELAIMAGSHSGEDLHVRTLQAVLRRAGVSQHYLGCGAEGAPLDTLTAARLARDGEKPGSLRHMCSGQHASMLLICRINDWPFEEYWRPDNPVQRLYSATVARAFSTVAELLIMSTDACGVPTYAFPLREVARAFAMLADPAAIPSEDTRSSLANALRRIRDAMMANPEMVAKAIAPDFGMGPHTASLGLVFYTGAAFPMSYRGGAFIGQHGSWNRKPLNGYQVVFIPFAGGQPQNAPQAFLTGFLDKNQKIQGRPVGVVVDKTGALLVADDVGGIVWRVTPTPAGAAAKK